MTDVSIPVTAIEMGDVVEIYDIFATFHTAMRNVSDVARALDYNDPIQREQSRALFLALKQMHYVYMSMMDLVDDAYSLFDLVEVRS